METLSRSLGGSASAHDGWRRSGASRDGWVFAAPAVAISALRVAERPTGGWGELAGHLLILLGLTAPVIVFALLRDRGLAPRSGPAGAGARVAAFLGYPALLLWANEAVLQGLPLELGTRIVPGLAAAMPACEILLELQRLVRRARLRRGDPGGWTRRLGVERALLLVLALGALGLSAMAVSDLDRFLAGQAVRPAIDPGSVLSHLPTFLAVAGQLFLAYLAGYGLYWINRHLLVRELLRRYGPVHYLAGAALTVALGYPVLAQLLTWLPLHRSLAVLTPAENMNPFDPVNGSVAVAILTLSLPVILALEWFRQNSRIVVLEGERVQAELEALKRQIDPHFFFNTLNNLYALSRRQAEETPELILRLSEMMRYVIYRGREATVPVEEEVRTLRDYVELQRLRLSGGAEIRFDAQLADPRARIAPLLLLVPVENAFKHGLAAAGDGGFIDLEVTSDAERLRLVCRNSVEPGAGPDEDEEGEGIGLANLRRRLELLYPGRHDLETEEAGEVFSLRLHVELASDGSPDGRPDETRERGQPPRRSPP